MYLIENIEEASQKIISICISSEIDYPVDKFNYHVGCEPVVYTNLIYKCIYILGLESIDGVNIDATREEVKKALLTIDQWLNDGYDIMSHGNADKRPPEEVPLAYFLNYFEQQRNKDPDQAINIHPAYYLLAVLFLYDYRTFCLASFRDKQDFDGDEVNPKPYQQSIDALGSLMNALLCTEHGGESLERACGNAKYLDVTNQLYELEAKQKKAQKGLTETNQAKALLKGWAQNVAVSEWKEDLAQEIRMGAMADHIIAKLPIMIDGHHSFQLDQKIFLKKHIPKNQAMRGWIRPVAPKYAKKGGR